MQVFKITTLHFQLILLKLSCCHGEIPCSNACNYLRCKHRTVTVIQCNLLFTILQQLAVTAEVVAFVAVLKHFQPVLNNCI